MSRQPDGKLNQLQEFPEGLVVNSRQLATAGYSRQLVAKYASAGWLQKLGRGAYRRPGPPLKWEHVAYSLQKMELPLHPGGETALGLLGHAHQLPASGCQIVHLYGVAALPAWVSASVSNVEFRHHAEALFDEPPPSWTQAQGSNRVGAWEPYHWGPWDWIIQMSSAERAWLELLLDIPAKAGFDDADELASGLRSLRPKRMESLLKRCTSIKVRRLALWLGERHHHAWVSKLDPNAIDLGSGKRSLVSGGRLVKRYGITVPKHLAEDV